jgi:hypothetical protein
MLCMKPPSLFQLTTHPELHFYSTVEISNNREYNSSKDKLQINLMYTFITEKVNVIHTSQMHSLLYGLPCVAVAGSYGLH